MTINAGREKIKRKVSGIYEPTCLGKALRPEAFTVYVRARYPGPARLPSRLRSQPRDGDAGSA